MEHHLPKLIEDLALILGAGAFTTLIFKWIKQPLVLGYIIAGFLVSPYFAFIPNVADKTNIETWANIGVIFLLFNLGLEFSFKKLLNVGGSASITAIVEIVSVMGLGYFVAQWMGWGTMDSLFLGGLLASSSTTIIIRAFEELGVKRKNFARIVFGVLIVEDIVVILLMVLLSTMAVSQQFDGIQMLTSLVKLLFFLALWFIFGIFLIPTLLRKAKRLIDEETLLILSIGLCMAMVVLATKIGFSAELGAFLMGSILAETTSAEKIEHISKPVKNLFGAVFFVSIGMMINPASMYEYRWEILIVTVLTIFGKLFFTTLGAILSGQPLKQSVQVGMSMAQIGEFAFIVATLGLTLKVTSDFLFPIAVGVSAITTFTTPYMIKYSDRMYQVINKTLPSKFLNSLENYSTGTQKIKEESDWKKLIRAYITLVLTNGIVVLGIVLLIKFTANYYSSSYSYTGKIIPLIIAIIACAPFLWALLVKKPAKDIYKTIWSENKFSRGPLVVIEATRILIVVLLIGFIVDYFYSGIIASLIVIPSVLIGLYMLSTKFNMFYSIISKKFIYNLNEREIKESKKLKIKEEEENLLPSDTHISDFEITQNATYIGQKLAELKWREKFGIIIAYIKRGDNIIYPPTSDDKVFPFDRLGLIATDDQLKNFEQFDETQKIANEFSDVENISINRYTIEANCHLIGKSIMDTHIKEETHAIIMGIQRDDQKILNPNSNILLKENDILWIAGEKDKINNFINR